MSELDKCQFRELFQNDRERLIQLLISEILFLDHCFNKAKKRKEKKVIKKAQTRLDKLLYNQQLHLYVKLSEEDYNYIISNILTTFKKALKKIK